MTDLDKETEERIEEPVSEEAVRETRLTPAQAVEKMRVNLPVRGNRKLRKLLERVNDDKQVKAWWHVANVNAVVRMEINDHSWVHIQIVANIALKLLRQLTKHGDRAVRRARLRARAGRRGGDRRAVRALPLRRHVGAPPRPRGLLALPLGAEDARAAATGSTRSRS